MHGTRRTKNQEMLRQADRQDADRGSHMTFGRTDAWPHWVGWGGVSAADGAGARGLTAHGSVGARSGLSHLERQGSRRQTPRDRRVAEALSHEVEIRAASCRAMGRNGGRVGWKRSPPTSVRRKAIAT